jgi:LsmAD domain
VSSAWLDPESATSLESGSIGDWNQFEANNRLFNVKNTYDENIYTKKLDLSTFSKAQILKAERIAKEIEGTSSHNIHIREERGFKIDSGIDEEDLYSGVMRETGPRGGGGMGDRGQGQGQGMGNMNMQMGKDKKRGSGSGSGGSMQSNVRYTPHVQCLFIVNISRNV